MGLSFADYEELQHNEFQVLHESINYNCEGEVKFEIRLNETRSHVVYLRDVHMQVCKSSWSNMWCTSPNSNFIKQDCSYKNTVLNTTHICVFDIAKMCNVIQTDRMYSNWFHSVYVVRVVGTANGMIYSTKQLALSPMRYQLQCKNNFLLGSRIRGYNKQCQISNYI